MTSPSQVRDAAAPALKPCPFCGWPADHRRYVNGDTGWIVIDCASDDCPSSPDTYGKDFEEAAERWNTRADPPQSPDGLAEDLARALEDAKVYVAIDCDGGSELRIRFEGPYSPERVHRARNADAALTAWRAQKGKAK